MTVRISADDLPPELVRKLEAGESVEIERAGEVVLRIAGSQQDKTDWRMWASEAGAAAPVDYDDLLLDLEHIRVLANRPPERPNWA